MQRHGAGGRRLAALAAHVCAADAPAGVEPEGDLGSVEVGLASLQLQPLGAAGGALGVLVTHLSIREELRRGLCFGSPLAASLRRAVTAHGLLLLRGQGGAGTAGPGPGLTCEELVAFSSCFGRGRLHSSHRVHHKAAHEDVFRVSNDPDQGCFEAGGVGTGGFHSDGFFLPNVYSNAVYQIVEAPASGEGNTLFADYAKATECLAAEAPQELERLRRLQAVCDTSGVIHPLVHRHPETGVEVLLIGGIAGLLEIFRGSAEALLADGIPPDTPAALEDGRPRTRESWRPLEGYRRQLGDEGSADGDLVAVRSLGKAELRRVMQRLQDLLSREDLHYRHCWQPGDVIVTDNLAVAHKAAKEAGDLACGLRILHRVTVAGSHVIQ